MRVLDQLASVNDDVIFSKRIRQNNFRNFLEAYVNCFEFVKNHGARNVFILHFVFCVKNGVHV